MRESCVRYWEVVEVAESSSVGGSRAARLQRGLSSPFGSLWIRSAQRYALWFSLLALCSILTVVNPRFLTVSNMINVLRQASVNLVLAVGMTVVILTGGIDLSVSSVLALAGCVACLAIKGGAGVPVGILSALALGSACGAINGFLVTKMRIPAFIATLGVLTIARGLALVSTGGEFVTGLPDAYVFIGGGSWFGIPVPVVIAGAVVSAAYFVLSRTKFGLQVYAVGGNYEAARLSGVNTHRVLMWAYMISGLLAGGVGVILTARVASAQPTFGEGYNLTAAASVIIGGTSIRGGEGSVLRTVLGALVIGVLSNGLNMLNVDYFWQQVVIGAVIIAAVMMDRYR